MENQFTYHEWKQMLVSSRGNIVEMLDLAQGAGDLSEKERDVMYYRLIEWNSLERTGQKFGVTRERIRQIEAKAEEKLRYLTKKIVTGDYSAAFGPGHNHPNPEDVPESICTKECPLFTDCKVDNT